MSNFFLYLLQYFGFIVIFYLAGHFIFKFVRVYSENPFFEITSKIITGFITSVVFFAVYRTEFKTILFGSIVPLILFVKTTNISNVPIKNKISSLNIFWLILISIFIFSLSFFSLNKVNDILFLPNEDYSFYAKASKFIYMTGKENALINHIYPPSKTFPYHYFELWLNALITFINGKNSIPNLIAITYPIIIFCIYLLIISIFYNKTKNFSSYIFVLVFIGMFISLVNINILYKHVPIIGSTLNNLDFNLWNIPKLTPVYLIIPLTVYFLVKEKNINKTIGSALFLPILYTPTAPTVYSSVTLWLILDFYIGKKNNYRLLIKRIIIVFLSAGYVYIFYKLLGDKSNVENINFDLSFFKTIFNIVVGTTASVIIGISPVFILVLFLVKRKKIQLFDLANTSSVFGFLIFITSLLSWACLYKTFDSTQLFSNLGIPVLNLGILIFLLKLIIQNKNKLLYIVVLALFTLNGLLDVSEKLRSANFSKLYSSEFIFSVRKKLNSFENKQGVCFKSKKAYRNPFINAETHYLGQGYTSSIDDESFADDLTIFNLSIENPPSDRYGNRYEKILKRSTFYRFVENQKNINTFISINQSQIDFINKYNIEYGIIDKDAEISSLLSDKIIESYTDKISGESFIIFK